MSESVARVMTRPVPHDIWSIDRWAAFFLTHRRATARLPVRSYRNLVSDAYAMTQEDTSPLDHTEDGTVVATAPAKTPAHTRRKPRQLPPYKVLLHNDDVSTIEHVVESITKLTSLNVEEAVLRTLEAHETGLTLLLVTHKERAELYADQFATRLLTVTIEPDAGSGE